MSAKLRFVVPFGVTTLAVAGSSTLNIQDFATGFQIQSKQPLYQLGWFGFSVSSASGTWSMRVMARGGDGLLRSIAGCTNRGSGTASSLSIDSVFGNTSFAGVQCLEAVEFNTAGVSASLNATVWGQLLTP